MEQTMKAVRIHHYGGPDVLRVEQAPVPTVASDDVLVRVFAAAINPVDWKVREGWLDGMLHHRLPLTPGWDVSGVVEAVGRDVKDFRPGDQVYSRPDIARDGAYAEFIAVRASELALKPKSLDHAHVAAIPLAALTAVQAFDNAGLTKGQTVLIHAAAGGVGLFAVQLAKLRGARVIGTASAANHDYVRALGADQMIDYQSERFEDRSGKVDVVFDLIGGETQQRSWSALKPGGALVSIVAPPSSQDAARHKVRGLFTFVQPDAAKLAELARLADDGRLKVTIAGRYPLEDAAEAQERIRRGHTRGKLVLDVAG